MKQSNYRKTTGENINTPQVGTTALFVDENGILSTKNEAGVVATVVPVPTKKVYKAILTQTGTDAPVAIVLENSLGEVPVWNYIYPGVYSLDAAESIFTENKTLVQFNTPRTITDDLATNKFVFIDRNSDKQILLASGNAIDTPADDSIFQNSWILIEVYT